MQTTTTKAILITFVVIVLLITILTAFVGLIFYLYQRKQHAFLRELQRMKVSYDQELLKSKIEVQDDTLQYISKEIHDNIGQYLTLAKLNLNSYLEGNSKDDTVISSAVSTITKALSDLRDLSKSISLDLIKQMGLEHAIDGLIRQIQKTERYDTVFEALGTYKILDLQTEIIIFRILQEALSNVIRHSQARTVRVLLDTSETETTLTVQDDGKGFNFKLENYTSKKLNAAGGITNMVSRAQAINAHFSIQSEPAKGTVVRISVPVENNHGQKTNER